MVRLIKEVFAPFFSQKKSWPPLLFPEKSLRPPNFFPKKVPAACFLEKNSSLPYFISSKYSLKYSLWQLINVLMVFANEHTHVTSSNILFDLRNAFFLWNLYFQNIVEKKSPPYIFSRSLNIFWKKSDHPLIFFKKKVFVPLSMVPAQVPDKFWPLTIFRSKRFSKKIFSTGYNKTH